MSDNHDTASPRSEAAHAVASGGVVAALPDGVDSPTALAEQLARTDYLAGTGLSTVAYLALKLGRPLFLEGEPGVGKTALAQALAELLDAPLIRLQCYEGIDASQALYDWDFPRQLLHLRAAETAGSTGDVEALEGELYDERFLLERPLLRALRTAPSVLLIDEIDRADDEFEAFLLELLSEFSVTIPELGRVHAAVRPVVIITSNRTREVHDALKRRCTYHWLDHPDFERECAIVRRRCPAASAALTEQVVGVVQQFREEDLFKPPGVAETIDWTQALVALGADTLDAELATATLGSVLKYREDLEHAQRLNVHAMLEKALSA
ncbi:AAA family ATPase [Euzebya tangerina]|uniref:AAA family ATPase n=1 Tax=Euzebya tangerina TaxID=591198 RepID=UPI000E3248A4|nr:MoxR family ATPase [Euzebya tangerina]